ncbi:hypothetical protein CEUSTIGMA_g9400.t1 [Chlamydomonas eustigma]|uniref:Uncharacterized protein n=1 Tax=Chlamydomonas eustigma TaxID=1157962 RepID=A0A250XGC3_9CHLO|nr:hypothetical protein CEUSTIGMA_g9400.t1 [Chlamydomonas eustigma]|eukprot:GAX81972.1 hypothetical protein CEUSTIGMA_g9400.t1 [Chlamydomonas eustigma]
MLSITSRFLVALSGKSKEYLEFFSANSSSTGNSSQVPLRRISGTGVKAEQEKITAVQTEVQGRHGSSEADLQLESKKDGKKMEKKWSKRLLRPLQLLGLTASVQRRHPLEGDDLTRSRSGRVEALKRMGQPAASPRSPTMRRAFAAALTAYRGRVKAIVPPWQSGEAGITTSLQPDVNPIEGSSPSIVEASAEENWKRAEELIKRSSWIPGFSNAEHTVASSSGMSYDGERVGAEHKHRPPTLCVPTPEALNPEASTTVIESVSTRSAGGFKKSNTSLGVEAYAVNRRSLPSNLTGYPKSGSAASSPKNVKRRSAQQPLGLGRDSVRDSQMRGILDDPRFIKASTTVFSGSNGGAVNLKLRMIERTQTLNRSESPSKRNSGQGFISSPKSIQEEGAGAGGLSNNANTNNPVDAEDIRVNSTSTIELNQVGTASLAVPQASAQSSAEPHLLPSPTAPTSNPLNSHSSMTSPGISPNLSLATSRRSAFESDISLLQAPSYAAVAEADVRRVNLPLFETDGGMAMPTCTQLLDEGANGEDDVAQDSDWVQALGCDEVGLPDGVEIMPVIDEDAGGELDQRPSQGGCAEKEAQNQILPVIEEEASWRLSPAQASAMGMVPVPRGSGFYASRSTRSPNETTTTQHHDTSATVQSSLSQPPSRLRSASSAIRAATPQASMAALAPSLMSPSGTTVLPPLASTMLMMEGPLASGSFTSISPLDAASPHNSANHYHGQPGHSVPMIIRSLPEVSSPYHTASMNVPGSHGEESKSPQQGHGSGGQNWGKRLMRVMSAKRYSSEQYLGSGPLLNVGSKAVSASTKEQSIATPDLATTATLSPKGSLSSSPSAPPSGELLRVTEAIALGTEKTKRPALHKYSLGLFGRGSNASSAAPSPPSSTANVSAASSMVAAVAPSSNPSGKGSSLKSARALATTSLPPAPKPQTPPASTAGTVPSLGRSTSLRPNLQRSACYTGLVGAYRSSVSGVEAAPAAGQDSSGAMSAADRAELDQLKGWLAGTSSSWAQHSARMVKEGIIEAADVEAEGNLSALPSGSISALRQHKKLLTTMSLARPKRL